MNLLKKSLLANASFSFLTAFLFILFSGKISDLFGLDIPKFIFLIGVGLLVFALFVYQQSKKQATSMIKAIILLDIAWVIGSAALIFFNPFSFTLNALIFIMLIALMVSLFAIGQYIGVNNQISIQQVEQ